MAAFRHLHVRYWEDFLDPWSWVASIRRREVERALGGQAIFERRIFLGEAGGTIDAVALERRWACAKAEPGVSFTLPPVGAALPRSSLPAAALAIRCRDAFPDLLPALEDELYRAYFTDGADLSDPAVLRRCAEAVGLRRDLVAHALSDPSLVVQALRESAEAESLGIDSAPAVLIPGMAPLVGPLRAEELGAAVAHAVRQTPQPTWTESSWRP